MDFSEAIKEIRQECYMSQQAFANELGVSFSTVKRVGASDIDAGMP